ncbi:MAG TPA: radical SAM protein [Candidatus Polarisedimenticolia bacterium]|nr:radical SAM protein [Candidatus Polarisedimenticolia bacterium]
MSQAVARIDERTESGAGVRPSPTVTTPAPGPSRAPQAPRPGRPKGFGRYLRPGVLAGMALKGAAHVAWHVFQPLNRRLPYGVKQPKWAPAPLMKSKDRTFPQLGFPRTTDSLCPQCVKDVRETILKGETDWRVLLDGKPGEIKARIVERDGQIWMEKECPRHGRCEDLMAMDADFLRRMERLYPGRDFRMAPDPFHNHGSSTIKYGRGAVLTVDLTNRCNMMCNPCFMDANQVGYVHELTWEDVKQILDNSINVKPRRQMSVQFSGGEPTLSPYFLDAVAYSRKIGYNSVQAATNGIRFAQDIDFARRAKAAGLRLCYLQFDGVTNEANNHRGVGNLFDVKKRAIENLKTAGIDVTLVTTIVNTINDQQVGPIIQFAIDNIDKINAVSFQPVSFTGRDEDIDDETRKRQRYTLSHLAHDVKKQLGYTEPMRDWYPLSASGPFSDLRDQLEGMESEWGSLKCGCHPNCGVGTMLLVNQTTRTAVPFPQILDTDRILQDLKVINDTSRPKPLIVFQFVLSVLRNARFSEMPEGMNLWEMMKIIDGHNGGRLGLAERSRYNWRIMMVAGMWFQDLFNYDFRRTEMCIIPYATQVGEVSFCAYNTGVGWRQIVEKMFSSHSTAQWFKEKGRHPIFAAGKHVPLGPGPETEAAIPVVSEIQAPGRSAPVSVGPAPAVLHAASGEAAGCGTGCGCH